MNSIESENYDQLHRWIQALQFSKGETIIIDGESGSGKSSLAMRIARDFGVVRISLDSYVRAGMEGCYADLVESEYFRDDIYRFKNLFPFIIIEGICVREVLQKYSAAWSAAIYIKKKSSNDIWHFLHNLHDFVSGKSSPVKIIEPHLSDYSYHARYKPHEKADFIYVRISD